MLKGKAAFLNNSTLKVQAVASSMSYSLTANSASVFIIDVRGYSQLKVVPSGGLYGYGKIGFIKEDGTTTSLSNIQPSSQQGGSTHNILSNYVYAVGSGQGNGTLTMSFTLS